MDIMFEKQPVPENFIGTDQKLAAFLDCRTEKQQDYFTGWASKMYPYRTGPVRGDPPAVLRIPVPGL
jgi:hypothetical protein